MIDGALKFVSLLLFCSYVRLSSFQYSHKVKLHETKRPNGVKMYIHPHSLSQHFRTSRRKRLSCSHSNKSETEPEIVYVDEASNNNNEIPQDLVEEMNAGQPSELVIMKDVRIISSMYSFVFDRLHQY
jgi:hypothetical protein